MGHCFSDGGCGDFAWGRCSRLGGVACVGFLGAYSCRSVGRRRVALRNLRFTGGRIGNGVGNIGRRGKFLGRSLLGGELRALPRHLFDGAAVGDVEHRGGDRYDDRKKNGQCGKRARHFETLQKRVRRQARFYAPQHVPSSRGNHRRPLDWGGGECEWRNHGTA